MITGRAHVQAAIAYRGGANADIRQADEFRRDPASYLGKLHAYTLVDLFAGYDWGEYSAELVVNNLFDARNEAARFVACSPCERAYVLPGRPRMIGLRLGAKF
jgi:outer membrane receptor protein involved in Fe transport